MNQVTNTPSSPVIRHSLSTLKQRKNPSPSSPPPFPGPQRHLRSQILNVAASSSSPCPKTSSSARRLHFCWLLGTEPKLVASCLQFR
ncbi:uncharacterized protein DS421_10g300610 [Arachis hypogaea]|nr:uncharacterized protein DS421_10g300610 [Arachis hypogaea]